MDGFWDSIVGWAKEHLSEWTMAKVYIACAIAGGTVLIGQTGLNLFGLGGDSDIDPDVDVDEIEGGDSLNFLSIRALAGFLTFFGLVGWGGTASHWSGPVTVLAAFGAGASVMVFVAFIMRMFTRMHSQGNVDPRNAVGKTARVYLKIPAGGQGKGKITVSVQGRSMEYDAVTSGAEIPSGGACRIVAQTTEDTFEVTTLEDNR
jgi:hypothetical protein